MLAGYASDDWAGIESKLLPLLDDLYRATRRRHARPRGLSGVDVGGGDGALLRLLQAASVGTEVLGPAPSLVCFDRPEVAALNRASASRPGDSAHGITFLGGDMFAEYSEGGIEPRGADVYLLSRVLHDWDDARALQLLSRLRKAALSLSAAPTPPPQAASSGDPSYDAAAGSESESSSVTRMAPPRQPVSGGSGGLEAQAGAAGPLLVVIDRVATAANAHALLSLHLHMLAPGARERRAEEWAARFRAGGWVPRGAGALPPGPAGRPEQTPGRDVRGLGGPGELENGSGLVVHNEHAIFVLEPETRRSA